MGLQARLDAFKATFQSGGPPLNVAAPVIERLKRAVDELVTSGIAKRALTAGAKAPGFVLRDGEGQEVSSASLLAEGPLVVSFYRGVWCPYCNMELQALETVLPGVKTLGASLVAISPQLPANSRKARRQNGLTFPILSDPGNDVAAAFGLRFRLSEDLIELHKGFGTELPIINGDASWTLPMPARFVIGRDQTILFAEVDPDWTRRPEPEDVLPVLRHAAAAAA